MKDEYFRRLVFINREAEILTEVFLDKTQKPLKFKQDRVAFVAMPIKVDGYGACSERCRWAVEDQEGWECTLFRTQQGDRPKRLRRTYRGGFFQVRACMEAQLQVVVLDRPFHEQVFASSAEGAEEEGRA